jgi:glycosyltransferase involved in cell wall biosynthesis
MVIRYLANVRLPTEKAHGLQIVENCEALARGGARVTLVAPRRIQRASGSADIWTHYAVARTFDLRRVGCIDLFPAGRWLDRVSAIVLAVSFAIAAALDQRRAAADVYYSRDVLPLLLLSLTRPRRTLAYEAHRLAVGRVGSWLQRACVRRVGTVFAVTGSLAQDLEQRGATRVIVLRDGFREGRFARRPDREAAREAIGLPCSAFCLGYVGQLETMGMAKGLDRLVTAIEKLKDSTIHLCLVGGPTRRIEALRAQWARAGLAPASFHAVGDVPAAEVPGYMAAMDVAVLLLPGTRHFRRHASPLKMFEYMAVGLPILATALPAITEVLRADQTALLVPDDDLDALRDAIAALRDDPALRRRLGGAARSEARAFTWDARAARVLQALRDQLSAASSDAGAGRTSQNTQPTPTAVKTM